MIKNRTFSKPLRILSIDGGGIRGLIPALVIEYLEKHLKGPIYKYFDFFAGTSTGGILTLGLLTRHPKHRNRPYSGSELIRLYREQASHIFSGSLGGMHPASGIENVLSKYFSNVSFEKLLKPCLIASYKLGETSAERIPDKLKPLSNYSENLNIPPQEHFFISKYKNYEYLVRDVARATSAAPTYFPTATIVPQNKPDVVEWLIDGGVFANNPALFAYAHLIKNGAVYRTLAPGRYGSNRTTEDVILVSLGTGHYQSKSIIGSTGSLISGDFKNSKTWGKIGWAKPATEIMFDASAHLVHYQLEALFNSTPKNYHRYDISLEEAISLDDSKNISKIVRLGNYLVESKAGKLASLARRLKS